ncbi:MAG: shikimate dehydrogenase [Coriobacteriia bacterium]|nr:shikimate dehydrogenase [Coriobacteriia bacterium]MBN2823561.1 shikimate dehydrogenase [Coriobacteriia bacterium]
MAGVIGWPVEHSLSPSMHNAAYENLGLNWTYLPLATPDQGSLMRVVSALRALSFVGFNVTMPYKALMLELCDEVAMFAQMAGAVNTVHCVDGRLIGYNTDGRGLLESLAEETGFTPEGRRVVVLGTGGAAGAAMVAFVLGKAAHLTIAGRDLDKADKMLARVEGYLRGMQVASVTLGPDAEEAVRSADLIVNATSLGMAPDDPTPVPAEWLSASQVVCDMTYACADTALRAAARTAGAKAMGGLGMLVAQGALAIDIWMESAQTRAPRDIMRAAAEEALEHARARESDCT